ncbi:hypothetical protein BDZ94DRAFT_1203379 [Collybia nuda]|uniref:rRNA biogenesis protein RRP36 n=1 Tax=Collybia nuda TaxID=64659 RepID=A0A9P6CDI8_9AGAR|nr:hypothetical protein BDZ94DRAFT_1203379 [Collybia nuda]
MSKFIASHYNQRFVDDHELEDCGRDAERMGDWQNCSHMSSNGSDFDEGEGATDTARIAQWEDDQDFGEMVEDSQGLSNIYALQVDVADLPLGALRKAQNILAPVKRDLNDVNTVDRTEPGVRPVKSGNKVKVKSEWSLKPRPDIAKRTGKNAPTEITSKRPVTRKRVVVDVNQVQTRDPRFLPLAGEFSGEKFHQHYGFLVESHKTELKALQTNLQHARKILASSPQGLLSERQQEVRRLELAVKRAESIVNNDRRNKVEREAFAKVAQEEKSKRKGGKAGWWLKESEKRELLVRARYDALVVEGGKRAVQKAIGRKQKKIGQKEKKSRPFQAGPQLGGKRGSPAGPEDGWPEKKRRRLE